ncbi:MAG: hypothetical protein GF347_04665 [Candidatus Moranbacteria bacterium]|nr:hypothetical protein [Candidatus Moranbacteria bacterium]
MQDDGNNKGSFSDQEPMGIELVTIKKNYLDEMESLRREEQELVKKFNIELAQTIFNLDWEGDFDYEANLNLFLNELAQVEEFVYKSSENFSQNDINICLSQLRILREKAKTAMAKAKEKEKELLSRD